MSEVFVLDATKRALNLVHPRAKYGSNRANNLVVACSSCNQRKGNQNIGIFLTDDAERLARILSQVKLPLRDAAVNATRFALRDRLTQLGLPLECHSGGRKKFNGVRQGLPKQAKRVNGFQTGDLVRAIVPKGTKQGRYVGRVAVRTNGYFNITTQHRIVEWINHRFCTLIARADGYNYLHRKERVLPPIA